MAALRDIAHDVQKDNPHLGSKTDIEQVLKATFETILRRVSIGEPVGIRGFGTFVAAIFKGRTLQSPLMKGGSVKFEDQLVFRFRQSQSAKNRINDMSEEYEGTKVKQAAENLRADRAEERAAAEANGNGKKTKKLKKKNKKKSKSKSKPAAAAE